MENSENDEDFYPPTRSRLRRERASHRSSQANHNASSSHCERHPNQRRRTAHDLKIPSEAGTAGQLIRVKLYNFMCHENFEIYFKNHVNFIFGKNGSGKSAILQAIQLCCGSTAKGTGRGMNLSNFVKTGCTSGKVMVSMWNTGSEAFRKHIFGRVITIERTISVRSTYSLIGENGQQIRTKKSDVDILLNYFGVVCSNPSVVLTQGNASSFLRGRHLPSDLYRLYMKVTEFEATVEKHTDARKLLEASKALIEEEKQHIEAMKAEKRDIAERTERAREEQTASIRLGHFQNAVLYLEANEYVDKIEREKNLIEQQEQSIADFEGNVNQKTKTRDEALEMKTAFNEEHQVEAVRDMLDSTKRELADIGIQKRAVEKDCKEPKKRIIGFESEMEEIKMDITDRQRKLETIKNDDGSDVRVARAKFDQKIHQKEKTVQEKQKELKTAEQSVHEIRVIIDAKEQQLSKISESCRGLHSEVQRLTTDIEGLHQAQNDPVKRFGGEVVKQLKAEIEQNPGQFHRNPIGPIGAYLSVKDDLWSTAIEFAIGRLFNSFIVHDFDDEKTLRALCRRTHRNLNPSIIVYSYDNAPYQINKYENCPHLSIKKVLQITQFEQSHILSNLLIDYGAIERTGLSNSGSEAFAIINSQTMPISPVWLPTGRKVYKTRNGEVSMHDGRKLQPRLVKDTSRLFKRSQQELHQAKEKFRSSNHQKMDLEGELRTLHQQQEEATQSLNQVSLAHQQSKEELEALKERGPDLPPSATHDIEKIQQEIRDLDYRLRLRKNQIEEAEEDLTRKETIVKEIEQRMVEKREMLELKNEDVKKLKVEQNRIHDILTQAESALNQAKLRLVQEQDKKIPLETTLQQLVDEKTALVTEAREHCNENEFHMSVRFLRDWYEEIGAPESELTSRTAKTQIPVLKRLVRNLRSDISEDFESLMAEKKQMDLKLNKQISLVSDQKRAVEESELGFKQREEFYRKQQQTMDKSINQHFKRYMKKRGHTGRIALDHRSQLVNIVVRIAGEQEVAKDLASLSGGERSYTTVALLLAFASIVNSPFHCMDEFDVFTDALTKHYSLMALLEASATEKLTSQFVFFSPQDVAAVEDATRAVNQQQMQRTGEILIPPNFVMIYTMAPPQR